MAHSDFAAYGKELREAIDDQFQKYFDDKVERLGQIIGPDSDTIVKTKKLSDFLRKDLTRRGLNVICERQEASDLALVRRTLKNGFVPYSDSDLEFLQKFGEWSDIATIIETVSKPPFSVSLLSDIDSHKFDNAMTFTPWQAARVSRR